MPGISPLNPLAFSAYFVDVDQTTGVETPSTAATVTAFLAVTKGGAAADPTLNGTVNYSGTPGYWTITFNPAAFTMALLDALFGPEGKAYLIVIRAGSDRVYLELEYDRFLRALLA
jgi:hypothetical protein